MRADFSPYCALKLIGEGGGEENLSAVQKGKKTGNHAMTTMLTELFSVQHTNMNIL